jgi:hypothetical protein
MSLSLLFQEQRRDGGMFSIQQCPFGRIVKEPALTGVCSELIGVILHRFHFVNALRCVLNTFCLLCS